MSGILVENLAKIYARGRVRALDGLNLDIRPGEVFGVIGPNGAGKTTLMGCLLGFLRPSAGRVTVEGLEPDDLAVRAVTGYLPERPLVDRWMTGRSHLVYHHRLAGGDPARRGRDIDEILDRVGLDAPAAARRIRNYSRGMLQRLGLAQALLARPRYLFLDEPTSGMDPAGMLMVRRLIGDLRRDGGIVILNSHHLDQVEQVCDRVAFVRAGRVEAVQAVHANRALERGLRVRFVRPAGTSPPSEASERERLEAAAAEAGAVLRRYHPDGPSFLVRGDDGAAALVGALVRAGYGVAEAVPEESGLERLFLAEGETE